MKTISIRDLQQRWPEVKKAPPYEYEIPIKHDGRRASASVAAADGLANPDWQ